MGKPKQIKQLVMTKGLPASGKTTWAKSVLAENPGEWKRVNKDDLRSMLDGGQWSKANEKFVIRMRDSLITAALSDGYNVIVDDTNFAAVHERRLLELAASHGAEFSTRLFDTDVEECITRDLKRTNSVGETVIRKMWRQYVRPEPEKLPYVEDAPHAIIVDLDGTLAVIGDRNPYDASRCEEDELSVVVAGIAEAYTATFGKHERQVLLMSGRSSDHRAETERWLEGHAVAYDELWMRGSGDGRQDAIIKRKLFDEHVRGKYNIDFVLDDRNQVVDVWRNDLGLTCLQVAEGDF